MTVPNWVKVAGALVAAVALAVLGHGWYAQIGENAVLRSQQAATQRSLDSLAKVAIVVATVYTHDSLYLTHTVTVYTERRDTLLVHLTDTVAVIRYVQAADSVIKACSQLQLTCEQRHQIDSATGAGWHTMYLSEKASKPSPILTVGKLAVAALAGFGLGRIGH